MAGIISSGFGFARTAMQAEPPTPMDNLIKDLEAKVPNLPPHEQRAMTTRIATMKTAAKADALRDGATNVGIEVAKFAMGKTGGAVGSAIGTYVFHGEQEKIKKRKNRKKIQKAKKVGGKRVNPKHGKMKSEETSALAVAAKVGLTSNTIAATGVTGTLTSKVTWVYNAAKSFVFGP
jgi:hypothetical protein